VVQFVAALTVRVTVDPPAMVNVKLSEPLEPTAFLFTWRKPLPPGGTMQSNGLLFPPLPADGYEHRFTSFAPAGSALLLMTMRNVELFLPAVNGSVGVIKLPL